MTNPTPPTPRADPSSDPATPVCPDHGLPLVIIGGGTMATAIVQGGLARGVLDARRIVVAEPDADKRARFSLGVASASDAIDWLDAQPGEPGQVLLAVKPQMLGAVATEIGGRIGQPAGGRVVISILAGVPGERVRAELGPGVRVVRVMPNTPARVGRGLAAIAPSAGAQPGDESLAWSIFAALGKVIELDESMMDAFTAVAGSGPAYVFALVEAMAAGAQRVGFDEATSRVLAEQTAIGAAALLEASTESAGALRRAVTSKGGTTQAALEVLEAAGVGDAIGRAIEAARDRGRALGAR